MSIVITQEVYKQRCSEYGFTPISPYVSIHSKIEVMCNKHEVKFITTLDQIKRCKCPKCYEENNNRRINNIKLTNDVIDSRLIGRDMKRIGDVCGRHTKIEWECLKCGNIWMQTPGNVIHKSNPTGCPKCNGGVSDNKDIFLQKIKDREDLCMIGDYNSSQSKTLFKCIKCDTEWLAKPANILNLGRGCPCCKFKSEKLVGDILIKYGYNAQHSVHINSGSKKYIIDWLITDKNVFIEYNGEQHYKPVKFGGMSNKVAMEKFEEQKIRDESLRTYCKNKSIHLLEIDGRIYNHRNKEKMEKYIINSIRGITNV